jgi:pyruvate dehydrogenase E1 component beta subunit|tara:strand:+ start:277 stop:1362 length:1086 start_codon:yes stop_codon:yes gene_type:complete
MSTSEVVKTERILTFAEAIREAQVLAMERDDRVFIIGEGVPDPKGTFGTTTGLRDRFGSTRVMDMPVSENGMTGILIGAALVGLRPIMTHQRMDFMTYSMEQLLNNAAKWHYMFGGQQSVPLVVRAVVGQGWGQGPQHSQNLHTLYAHIPGLKVVMPSTACQAKGLLLGAIADPNPVIFIEHRWLHGTKGSVPETYYEIKLDSAELVSQGDDLTIVTHSLMALEARKVLPRLKDMGIGVDLIDLRTVRPLDQATILTSVRKTHRLLVVDTAWRTYGLAAEIIASVVEQGIRLLSSPQRITLPDYPVPSSPGLTRSYYPNSCTILRKVNAMFGDVVDSDDFEQDWAHLVHADIPDSSFTGPF